MKSLDDEEYRRLELVMGKLNHRDRLALGLGLYCDLRISEIVGSQPNNPHKIPPLQTLDIDTVRRKIFIRDSKGKKSRTIPIPMQFVEIIDSIDELYEWKYAVPNWTTGESICQWALRKIYQNACDKAGITEPEKRRFHCLRHTFAMNYRRKGGRLEDLKELLGHSSLASTGIYLVPSFDEIQQRFDEVMAE